MNEMRKLMESVEQLSEEYVEYRDPDGDFQVIYDFPRGYFAVGKNDAKQDISGESFDNLDDAIEHAEICLSYGNDAHEDQFVDESYADGEPDLRLKIEKMIVPQVQDDANPEEWIQLMIYAFDELDMEFDVEVATAVLADYGMKPHCDLQARFGESIEEDKNSAALHTVNANYAQLKKELVDLVTHHKNERDPDVWYVLQDLESIIERYTK